MNIGYKFNNTFKKRKFKSRLQGDVEEEDVATESEAKYFEDDYIVEFLSFFHQNVTELNLSGIFQVSNDFSQRTIDYQFSISNLEIIAQSSFLFDLISCFHNISSVDILIPLLTILLFVLDCCDDARISFIQSGGIPPLLPKVHSAEHGVILRFVLQIFKIILHYPISYEYFRDNVTFLSNFCNIIKIQNDSEFIALCSEIALELISVSDKFMLQLIPYSNFYFELSLTKIECSTIIQRNALYSYQKLAFRDATFLIGSPFFSKVVKSFGRLSPQNFKIAFTLIETIFLDVPEKILMPIIKIFPFGLFEEILTVYKQSTKLQISALECLNLMVMQSYTVSQIIYESELPKIFTELLENSIFEIKILVLKIINNAFKNASSDFGFDVHYNMDFFEFVISFKECENEDFKNVVYELILKFYRIAEVRGDEEYLEFLKEYIDEYELDMLNDQKIELLNK